MGSTDESSAPDKVVNANYNSALDLQKSNPPEQRLDIHLPHAYFTETVTVVTCPAKIHESAAGVISSAIYALRNISEVIGWYGSTMTDDFGSVFGGSTKQSDGGVDYDGKVTVVVEVGFSEDYMNICRSKDMWIDGHGVNVYILVCLTERPRTGNIGDVDAVIAIMERTINETLDLNLSNNRHALIFDLIQNGHTCDLPTTLGIKMSDFFPDNAWRAANIPDEVIPFSGTRYVRKLTRAMAATALNRAKRQTKQENANNWQMTKNKQDKEQARPMGPGKSKHDFK
ncbi:hypothetical protein V1509DRAFT_651537 [Lipomyces kononenkoae]